MELQMSFRNAAERATRALPQDARVYQIAALSSLLAYGLTALHFEIGFAQVTVTIASAIATQWAGTQLTRPRTLHPRGGALGPRQGAFDPKSALISALSLCLLLRTPSLFAAAAAAAIAVGSKFALRWHGKHLFNPTNFALVVMLATGMGWVSPGQWGNPAFFAFAICCLGTLVVTRAARADITLAFLGFHAAILFGYAAWLGQPAAIPLHRMQSGALLLFAFFMISDPRTTPNARAGRVLFALLVAAGAACVQFALYRTNGLLWSLVVCSTLTPLIDRLMPGSRFAWTRVSTNSDDFTDDFTGGDSHENAAPFVPAGTGARLATGRI